MQAILYQLSTSHSSHLEDYNIQQLPNGAALQLNISLLYSATLRYASAASRFVYVRNGNYIIPCYNYSIARLKIQILMCGSYAAKAVFNPLVTSQQGLYECYALYSRVQRVWERISYALEDIKKFANQLITLLPRYVNVHEDV